MHIEVQGRKESRFAERMYQYHYRIRDRYNRPVVSLALLCDPSPTWRPSSYGYATFGCQVTFQFPSIKLLDYRQQWEQLAASHNPFATIVMAHLQAQATRRDLNERKTWKLWLIRRLYDRGYSRQDVINLFLFIDWVMSLSAELEQEFWQEVKQYEEERRMPYISSVEQIGREKGRQEVFRTLMESRFGRLDRPLRDLLPQLLALSDREATESILQCSQSELIRYFDQQVNLSDHASDHTSD